MEWKFEPTMEAMTDEELAKRIRAAYEYEIPSKIRPIPYIGDRSALVTYESHELIARCPVTGSPDLYHVTFAFVPGQSMPELKTLKFYLMAYFELPISHEHLASKIYNDFIEAVGPERFRLTLDVAVRGGIKTQVVLGEI
jgi:7-cyano-7-deazaguanine reductase